MGEFCKSRSGSYACAKQEGHFGRHEAVGGAVAGFPGHVSVLVWGGPEGEKWVKRKVIR